MPAAEPIGLRVARKLRQQDSCVVWTGATRPNGYGVIGGSRLGEPYYDQPHRVVYKLTRGPIAAGHQIDHLCRVRSCCNPDHLEAVTQAENVRRENAHRWRGDNTPVPATTCTVRDLVALLTGERP